MSAELLNKNIKHCFQMLIHNFFWSVSWKWFYALNDCATPFWHWQMWPKIVLAFAKCNLQARDKSEVLCQAKAKQSKSKSITKYFFPSKTLFLSSRHSTKQTVFQIRVSFEIMETDDRTFWMGVGDQCIQRSNFGAFRLRFPILNDCWQWPLILTLTLCKTP